MLDLGAELQQQAAWNAVRSCQKYSNFDRVAIVRETTEFYGSSLSTVCYCYSFSYFPQRCVLLSVSSSSSLRSAPIIEHSRLHKLTPLWTILRTHPRCVETNVVGPKVELYCMEPCPPWSTCPASPIRWRTIDGCSKNARVVLWWVGSRKMPNRRSRLFAVSEGCWTGATEFLQAGCPSCHLANSVRPLDEMFWAVHLVQKWHGYCTQVCRVGRSEDPGDCGGLDPLKICWSGQSIFWPPKMSHSFAQNCCWITLQVLRRQGWKTCVKNGR